MSKYALDRHKRAARAFGYALTLGDEPAWDGFAVILLARLTDRERGALAYTALRSLSTEQAMIVASLWTGEEGAGMPIAPFDTVYGEAVFWAEMASSDELDAYALACFNQMTKSRQASFLAYIGKVAA